MKKETARRTLAFTRNWAWGIAFCAGSIFSLGISLSHAAFLEPYWSARVAALGGAYTAVADDATGIFYNPAAGIRMRRKQADFSYSKLFTGLDSVNFQMGHFSYAQPLGGSSAFGIGWARFSAVDLYREDTILLSFAQSLRPLFHFDEGELALGASAKMLMRQFAMTALTSADPVFKDGSAKNALAVDAHLYALPAFWPALSLGLTVRSLNSPDIGFQTRETLPLEIVGGMALRWRNVTFPIDVSSRKGGLEPRFGAEAQLLGGRMALRAGGDFHQVGMGMGFSQDISPRLAVSFDYTFLMPLAVEGTSGSHRASIGFKF